jgi:hypothetical protein
MVIEVTFDVTDVYISTTVSPVYVNVSFEAPSSGGGTWGSITGTLSNQTDLQNALNAKYNNPTGTTSQYLRGDGSLATFPAIPSGTVTSVGLTMPSAFSVANSPITSSGTLAVTATGDTTQYIAGDGSLVAFPITGQAGTLVREVRNVTGATLTKGTVVYINGASGNKPTVAKALATGDATSAQTFGLIQADIANNSNGYLVAFGDLDGLNTSAFAEGVQLYLSSTTAGGYTSTKQYAPNHLVYIGVVTRQHINQGRIEVRIQNGYEMDELHDVAAQTPSNNHGLFYNSTNSLWENKSIATALGYTPANAGTTLTINGVTYDLSTSRTWTISTGISGSGASGQVSYWNGTTSQAGSNNLFWDATNSRLGIGTNAPSTTLDVRGKARIQASGNCELDFVDGANSMRVAMGSTQGFIGTLSSHPFGFFTAATERARISTNGNLLINSTSDSGERLQVTGDVKIVNGTLTSTHLKIGTSLNVGSFSTPAIAFNTTTGIYSDTNRIFFVSAGAFAGGFSSEGFVGTTAWVNASSGANDLNTPKLGGYRLNAQGLSSGLGGNSAGDVSIASNNLARFVVKYTGEIGIGTSSPNASAITQIDSTTKGFLPPRMTTTQKNAIASPTAGLVVYDTTLAKLCVYTTAWETITSI